MPLPAQTAVFGRGFFAAARAVEGVDRRVTVECSPVPIAVVNGAADRLVNLDYFQTVAYANLWVGRCQPPERAGSRPLWEAPGEFDPVLERVPAGYRRGGRRTAVELAVRPIVMKTDMHFGITQP